MFKQKYKYKSLLASNTSRIKYEVIPELTHSKSQDFKAIRVEQYLQQKIDLLEIHRINKARYLHKIVQRLTKLKMHNLVKERNSNQIFLILPIYIIKIRNIRLSNL